MGIRSSTARRSTGAALLLASMIAIAAFAVKPSSAAPARPSIAMSIDSPLISPTQTMIMHATLLTSTGAYFANQLVWIHIEGHCLDTTVGVTTDSEGNGYYEASGTQTLCPGTYTATASYTDTFGTIEASDSGRVTWNLPPYF